MISLRRRFGHPDSGVTMAVHADNRGVAVGRDVQNSTIKIGLDEEETARLFEEHQQPVFEQLSQLVEQVARDKGVPAAPLRAILAKLDIIGVADFEIPQRLNAAADELLELRARLSRSELAPIREQALALIDEGEFDKASDLIDRCRERAREQRINGTRMEADLLADSARIAHLQLAYRTAATKYAEAAALAGQIDKGAQWGFLNGQAAELLKEGTQFGSNEAIMQAIDILRHALALVPAGFPSHWAKTQMNIGVALNILGEREGRTDLLEQAVAVFRQALNKRGAYSKSNPLDLAMTLHNLAISLWRLGERENGTSRLKEALAACLEALKKRPRKSDPLGWAGTQHMLGNVLWRLGERERSGPRLQKAADAFREALKEQIQGREPLEWAATQNSLALVLSELGEMEGSTSQMWEAVEAYRQVLKVATRERAPLQWALAQTNLANALQILSEDGDDLLEKALAGYHEALKERTRELVPFDWAETKVALARAHIMLGEREGSGVHFNEAVAALREALQEYRRDDLPYHWARTQWSLGHALAQLGWLERNLGLMMEAVTAFRQALQEIRRDDALHDWAQIQFGLGHSLAQLGTLERNPDLLRDALTAYENAQKGEWTPEWGAVLQHYIDGALRALRDLESA